MTPLEQRFAATPPREIPAQWRARILAAAGGPARPRGTFAALLWPHPIAWGALAACWLVIAALNFSGPRGEALAAVNALDSQSTADPAEMLAAMREQHRLFELWVIDSRFNPRQEFILDRRKL